MFVSGKEVNSDCCRSDVCLVLLCTLYIYKPCLEERCTYEYVLHALKRTIGCSFWVHRAASQLLIEQLHCSVLRSLFWSAPRLSTPAVLRDISIGNFIKSCKKSKLVIKYELQLYNSNWQLFMFVNIF